MGSTSRGRARHGLRLPIEAIAVVTIAIVASVCCEAEIKSYGAPAVQQSEQPSQFYGASSQIEQPGKFYDEPSQNFGVPSVYPGQGQGQGQGQVQSSGQPLGQYQFLPAEQSVPFSPLSPARPDMYYFSPRDQVLYKVSLLPLDGGNVNALGLGAASNGGNFDTFGGLSGGSAPVTTTTPAPAPTLAPATAAQNASTAGGGPPFAIEFEVEEETGGEYVGGFGATEGSSQQSTTPAPAASAAASLPSGGAGTGTETGGVGSLANSLLNGNQNALSQLLLNSLRNRNTFANQDRFNDNNFQTYGQPVGGSNFGSDSNYNSNFDSGSNFGSNYNSNGGSGSNFGSGSNYNSNGGSGSNYAPVSNFRSTSNTGSRSDSVDLLGGYSSHEPDYADADDDEMDGSDSDLEGAATGQITRLVLPPNVRISPQLAQYLADLSASANRQNSNQSQNPNVQRTVVPNFALPENLDAATGTPGQAQRRVRKRMKFKSGGAIG